MDIIIIAGIVVFAVAPTFVALLSLRSSNQNARAIEEVHLTVNSRMDELLKASKAESKAEGRELGRSEDKE